MTIDFSSNSIMLTSSEMNEAKKYNSQAYRDLMDARRDNPGYRIIEVKTKRTKTALDSISMVTIKAYVKAHGSEEQKREFLRISTTTYTEDDLRMDPQSFFNIKKWFLAQFPQVKDAYANRENEIRAINEAIDAKIEEAKTKAKKEARAKAQAKAEEFLKTA